MKRSSTSPCASYERELLAKGMGKGKYTRLSCIEQSNPVLLAFPYFLLLVYSLYLLFLQSLKWIPHLYSCTYSISDKQINGTIKYGARASALLHSYCACLS